MNREETARHSRARRRSRAGLQVFPARLRLCFSAARTTVRTRLQRQTEAQPAPFPRGGPEPLRSRDLPGPPADPEIPTVSLWTSGAPRHTSSHSYGPEFSSLVFALLGLLLFSSLYVYDRNAISVSLFSPLEIKCHCGRRCASPSLAEDRSGEKGSWPWPSAGHRRCLQGARGPRRLRGKEPGVPRGTGPAPAGTCLSWLPEGGLVLPEQSRRKPLCGVSWRTNPSWAPTTTCSPRTRGGTAKAGPAPRCSYASQGRGHPWSSGQLDPAAGPSRGPGQGEQEGVQPTPSPDSQKPPPRARQLRCTPSSPVWVPTVHPPWPPGLFQQWKNWPSGGGAGAAAEARTPHSGGCPALARLSQRASWGPGFSASAARRTSLSPPATVIPRLAPVIWAVCSPLPPSLPVWLTEAPTCRPCGLRVSVRYRLQGCPAVVRM